MGKLAIGAIAFAGGVVVGALIVRAYVQANPLGVLAPGAAAQLVTKIFGTGPTGQQISDAAYNTVDHLVTP